MWATTAQPLPSSWTPLREIAEQRRLINSKARYRVVAAGRRSGKTELAKRWLVSCALDPPEVEDPTYIACAPTRDQAKRIFWKSLKKLVPKSFVVEKSETELTIWLVTGAIIMVVGLDKPERVEGIAIDGAIIDEIQECKPGAWKSSIRPALSTPGRPPGWAWFTGRPRGRGFFYELWRDAKTKKDWEPFRWKSAVVVDPEEIAAAREDLDDLTFRQEYEADWISFEGRAYHAFDEHLNVRPLEYDPGLPLHFCFDFNVRPGTASVIQEQVHKPDPRLGHRDEFQATCVIGEVWIPQRSTTVAVCEKLVEQWGHHTGDVYLHGDATGSASKTSSTLGDNDWDQIEQHLISAFPSLHNRVPRSNPPERARVNSVNARLRNAAGRVWLLVDPRACPHVVEDLEGVTLLEGGTGQIDKKADPSLTHLTDGIGYYVHAEYPLGGAIGASH